MGFEYDTTSLQMMAAGTGSSVMQSDSDIGNIEEYENLFSKVRSVKDKKKTTGNKVVNPEEKKQQPLKAIAKQMSVTTQEDEFEVVQNVKKTEAPPVKAAPA